MIIRIVVSHRMRSDVGIEATPIRERGWSLVEAWVQPSGASVWMIDEKRPAS